MLGRRSIRFRLTVWYTVILAAGLSLFSVLVWLSLRQRLLAEIDHDLEGRAGRFEKYFNSESLDASGDRLRDELDEFCQALPPGSRIELRGASGFTFHYLASAASSEHRTLERQFKAGQEQFDLEVSVPIDDELHTLALLRLLLLGLTPVVIAIACAGGAWLSGRALKPVHDITAAALTISIENLSERLPVPPTGDELARLTEVLNSMFQRLEAAVKTLSQFVADASHELRTPLAVIRTTAELALRRERTADSYRDSLQEVTAEAERMTHLVEDLLVLARSESELAEMPLAAVDVRDVLQEVCAEMCGLAAVRDVRIQSSLGERPAVISGNRPALHRLFLVLLDNAVKYSRYQGEVILRIESSESRITVTIQDFGEGIREADLPHIFERFYQADRARSNGGHGLGLALADSLARAHGANIEVRSTEGVQSTFCVNFIPRDARPAAVLDAFKVGNVPSVRL